MAHHLTKLRARLIHVVVDVAKSGLLGDSSIKCRMFRRNAGGHMNRLIYLVGLIVIVLVVLGFFGMR
jgi:hypothetical protein